jgi:endo-1,4-beta-mannosidase
MRHVWDRYNRKDIEFARSIGKPLYAGEVGFKAIAKRDRAQILRLDIKEKFSLGASGYVLWSFQAQGWNNDGHDYGFGPDEGFEEVVKKCNINKLPQSN